MRSVRSGFAALGIIAVCAAGGVAQPLVASAAPITNDVYVSEVESKGGEPGDWFELFNSGSEPVDLSGFVVKDSDDTHVFVIPEGTIIEPGAYLVFDEFDDKTGLGSFDFGLGKSDIVRLFDKDGETLLDAFEWEGHAESTYIRAENGDVVEGVSSKGLENTPAGEQPGETPGSPETPADLSVVINEIVFDDPVGHGHVDSIELYNAGSTTVDLTGWSVHDDKDRPGEGDLEGELAPGEYLVLEKDMDFEFGLGKGDSVRLMDQNGAFVDEYTYEAGARLGDWSRCPDGVGEFGEAGEVTLGAANTCEVPEEEPKPGTAVINEVDSAPADAVELFNPGDEPFDLSGFELRDNSDDHRFRIAEGTVLEPGAFLVIDDHTAGEVFDQGAGGFVAGEFAEAIGLGSSDQARLFDANGELVDSVDWKSHAAIEGDQASATLSRCPDGEGVLSLAKATLGKANECVAPKIALNEIESNGDATDWVEIKNVSDAPIDLSGWYVLDNDPVGHARDVTPVPVGTVIDPGEYFVFDQNTHFTFGLGKNDKASVFTGGGVLAAEHEWSGHADVTLARCPDGEGAFVESYVPTKGAANGCSEGDQPVVEDDPAVDGVELSDFPGGQDPAVIDEDSMFYEDSSGLDFEDGFLWAVDNGTGAIWKLVAHQDGTVEPAEGFESPKRVRFAKDVENPKAKGPDAEGITVAGDGKVYLAVERDNSNKGVNFNAILQVDPNAEGPEIVASKQWDITALLPQVSANTGIESVEWVPSSALEGKLWDSAKNAPFTSANYPDATANGVFFVALEDNGHVYALVLNDDDSATVIADLDSKIGGAMGLDYDALTDQLWVMADDGYEGRLARFTFTGEESPVVVHMRRPANMPNVNNEGFALSDRCVEGTRPAWFFQDGVEKGALTSVQVPCVFEGPTDAGQSSDEQPSGESSQSGGAERGAAARPHESGAAGAPRAGQLPRTGAETRVLGGFACALVVTGAVLASRRTRRA